MRKSTSLFVSREKQDGKRFSFSILVLKVDLVAQELLGRRIREPNFGEFLDFKVFFFSFLF